MKRQALSHIKTHRLMRLLQIPLYQAVGLLEVIWCHAEEHYYDGALRGLRAADIAALTGWQGDDESLLSALIDAGWIDRMEDGTLILHDWHEHCADYIHARLARAGAVFASGASPRTTKLGRTEHPAAADGSRRQPTAADGARRLKTAANGSRRQPTQDPRPKTITSSCGESVTPNTPLPPTPPPLTSRPVEISPPTPAAEQPRADDSPPLAQAESEQQPGRTVKPLPLPADPRAAVQVLARRRSMDSSSPASRDGPRDERSLAIAVVGQMLSDWMEHRAAALGPPDEALCKRLLELHGWQLDSVAAWLKALRRRSKHPGSVQSWGWFLHLAECDLRRPAAAAVGGSMQ